MPVTTIEGIVENGQIQLPAHVHLPEKTKVYIVIPDVEVLPRAYVANPRLAHPEQTADFKKVIIENDEDAEL